VGPLCTMQSHRWTTSVGIFLMGAGAILSSFAKTGVDLYLSVGVVAGSGQGLVTNTAILILVDHFQEKQGLALGISFMVMAVAGIVSPQIVQLLSRAFTYNVSILIYAVQFLVGLIGSALFFPVDNIKVVTAPQEDAGGVDEVDAVHSRFDQSRHSQKVKRELQASVETADTTGKPLIKSNDDPAGKSGRGWRRNPCVLMFTLINWSLAKRPHFILTVLGSSYSFNALMSFFLFLPLYAESIHCSTYQKVRMCTW
jgi:MFS family permease